MYRVPCFSLASHLSPEWARNLLLSPVSQARGRPAYLPVTLPTSGPNYKVINNGDFSAKTDLG